jgi:hypothetical protein
MTADDISHADLEMIAGTPLPEPLAVDSRGAARLLSVSPRTIVALTSAGSLPSLKIMGRRLYSVASLREFVRGQEKAAQAQRRSGATP